MKILIEVTVPDPVGFDSLGREEQMFWITQDPDWQQVTGEPVAWRVTSASGNNVYWCDENPVPNNMEAGGTLLPVYAAPVLRSLSDDAILDMAEGCTAQYHDLLNFAHAIEDALRGKK